MTFFLITYVAHLLLVTAAYFATRAIPVYFTLSRKRRLMMFLGMNAVFLLPLELLVAASAT